MSKVVFVLCDGLRYDTAVEMMGYMEHMVEHHHAVRYQVIGEMPSISRPMYETTHTGVPVSVHGVTSNLVVRPSIMPNIFSVARQHGLTTAASAYWWFSELYNGCPYDPALHKEVDDENLLIQHGRFYTADPMPDEETFNTGQYLMKKYHPDYLLIHPMGMDNLGHIYGPDSNEYRNNALLIDITLATRIPEWLEKGYQVVVSADHGMGRNNSHGGSLPEARNVPLYIISPEAVAQAKTCTSPSQLSVAPTILRLLGLPAPETMEHPSLIS